MIGLWLACLGCTCAPGDRPDAGKWFERAGADDPLSAEQRAEIAQLEALGYAAGTRPGLDGAGVVTLDPERAVPGFFFYASGHGPEAVLRTLEGHEVHRWRRPFRTTWPLYPVGLGHGSTQNFRRAKLAADGSVVAIHEGLGILKIDADSELVWKAGNRAHHDLELRPDGSVVHLARQAHVVPAFDPDRPVLEDFVVWLDPDGAEVGRVSVLRALLDSPWDGWVDGVSEAQGDVLHTNSLLELGPEAHRVHPAFVEGRLLLSFRTVSGLAVLDPDTGALVWALRGDFRKQHDPLVTADGRLLVFDNAGQGRGRSRVAAVDPDDGSITWQWPPPGEPPLDSHTLGALTELAGGHLLVTESESGRALELTPEGEVVWEWRSPHRAGPDGRYVAALFEAIRLPAGPLPEWVDGADESRRSP